MSAPQLTVVTRGKFKQIVSAQGAPVLVKLYGCGIDKPPYLKNGKTYLSLDISEAAGQLDLLHRVDELVHRHAKPRFSPVWGMLLIAKMNTGGGGVRTMYETAEGDPGTAFPMPKGAAVDVELAPGAFGEFGYCWLVRRVKPASAQV